MTTADAKALVATLTIDDLTTLIASMVYARLDSHPDSPEAAELPRLIDASTALRARSKGPHHG